MFTEDSKFSPENSVFNYTLPSGIKLVIFGWTIIS